MQFTHNIILRADSQMSHVLFSTPEMAAVLLEKQIEKAEGFEMVNINPMLVFLDQFDVLLR